MKYDRSIEVIMTHTDGQAVYNVLGEYNKIYGSTMQEKFLYSKKHLDHIRKFLCYEPRGYCHNVLTFLTEPCSEEAQYGVLFATRSGWEIAGGLNMVSMGTVLVERGMVLADQDGVAEIVFDTVDGLVRTTVRTKNGIASEVSCYMPPSFTYDLNVPIQTKEWGTVCVDLAYGGLNFGIIDAKALGMKVSTQTCQRLLDAGIAMQRYINEQVQIEHYKHEYLYGVTHVILENRSTRANVLSRNLVVCPSIETGGWIDRSSGGTAVCAKAATLNMRGCLPVGGSFIQESIVGSLTTCKNIKETTVFGMPAICTVITGSAYITGICKFLVTSDDPFSEGFILA